MPKVTMYIAFLNVGVRIIYSIMYATKGANARLPFAILMNFSLWILAIAALVVAFIKLSEME